MSIPGSASPLFFTAAADGAAAVTLEKSVRFVSGDSAHLDRTPSSAGNRKTWTLSFWVKNLGQGTRNRFHFVYGAGNENTYLDCNVNATGSFQLSSWGTYFIDTTAKFRDPSAWYHFVVQFDTTNSTAADRRRLWVNGVEFATGGSAPTLDAEYGFNNNYKISIGSALTSGGSANNFSDCYLADYYFIDGQAKEATDFGAFDNSGVWQAAAYSGTFGTNGFHLFDFANETGIGNDSSGNDNDFTVNNISSTAGEGNDLLRDVPTNGSADDDTGAGGEVSGNYCTWNPLTLRNGGTGTLELLDGNLNFGDQGTNNRYGSVAGTIAVNSGKWFFEITYGSGTGVNNDSYIGLMPVELLSTYNTNGYFNVVGSIALRNDKAYKKGEATQPVYATGVAIGDTISVAFDCDTGSSTWYLNGTSLGAFPFTFDTQYSYTPFAVDWSNDKPISEFILNCGQRAFSMTAPTGYKPICTTMLPDPTIADGSDYFDAALWTGNGTSQSITGLEFSPDFVWVKGRNAANGHNLQNTLRGTGKFLQTHTTSAEGSSTTKITAFNSDGFSVGSNAGVNNNNDTYVGWAWDAGSSTASNTDGSITSSVRANQTAGFSIVTYTGTGANGSIGHGLNSKPAFAIFKPATAENNWGVYHESLGATNIIFLNKTFATSAHSSYFQDTEPTSSIFTLGADGSINTSSETMLALIFSPVAGYSAFGSYAANGSTDGVFVYTGFRPAFIIVKRSSSTGSWGMFDTSRDTYNVADSVLYGNLSNAEAASDFADILSNGFKLRSSSNNWNGSGTYIYMAWAENPFSSNGGLAR